MLLRLRMHRHRRSSDPSRRLVLGSCRFGGSARYSSSLLCSQTVALQPGEASDAAHRRLLPGAQLTFVYNGDRVGVTDEGTRALAAGLRSLRRLNLSWHRNLGDAAAGALATMTALTHLDLGYCDKVKRV